MSVEDFWESPKQSSTSSKKRKKRIHSDGEDLSIWNCERCGAIGHTSVKPSVQQSPGCRGHLRAHQEEIKAMKSRNFPGRFSNSESITRNTQPLTISHLENLSEGAASHPSCLILNGVCQFNTDEIQSFMDGMSLSENAMPCFRNNCCKLPSLVDVVPDVDQGFSSNQSPGFKKLSTLDSLAGKRGCSGESRGTSGTVNELKRIKINSEEMELDGPPKRELLLFKAEDSNSVSGMPFDLEEGETNLDLSLHL